MQKLFHSRAKEDTRVDRSRSMPATEGTGGFWPAYKLLCYWQGPSFLFIFVRLRYQADMCAILKQCVAFSVPTSALLPTEGNTATLFRAGSLNWDLWTHWSWLNPQKQQSNKRSHSRPSGICLGVQTILCLRLVQMTLNAHSQVAEGPRPTADISTRRAKATEQKEQPSNHQSLVVLSQRHMEIRSAL